MRDRSFRAMTRSSDPLDRVQQVVEGLRRGLFGPVAIEQAMLLGWPVTKEWFLDHEPLESGLPTDSSMGLLLGYLASASPSRTPPKLYRKNRNAFPFLGAGYSDPWNVEPPDDVQDYLLSRGCGVFDTAAGFQVLEEDMVERDTEEEELIVGLRREKAVRDLAASPLWDRGEQSAREEWDLACGCWLLLEGLNGVPEAIRTLTYLKYQAHDDYRFILNPGRDGVRGVDELDLVLVALALGARK